MPRMMKIFALAIVWLMLIGMPGACAAASESTATAPAGSGKPLQVVATTSILADLTKNVAGDAATVTSLLPIGSDPHSFEPSPRDSQRVANADVLIENGIGLETWLEPMIQNSGTRASRVVVSEGLTPRAGDTHAGEATLANGKGQHDHELDPHMWTNVHHVIAYVARIRDGLAAADPANAALYQANAARYTTQLQELDAFIVQQAAAIPAERRKLVTNHETFGYFADRYGFEIVGTVLPSVSAEAQPSAQDIARLVDSLKQAGATAVFTEATANPALADQIARDAGVKGVRTLYTDSLGAPGSAGDTYIKMMRYDIEQIVQALK
ncbi:MAG: zinc ABC transporter substrate-binding protein [Anaerolineae bacterium]|nr:zinc ABC transporter substrate-binding protein [Anaerolineae bacterium]